ncbi:MAG TPA: V-type ATPase 116kDa subunit family protein [Candidatus Atribacteria bacterium]|nr:V-type ATPase 116kDa subunit family protein [Candidatus Atribacteria bacterium]
MAVERMEMLNLIGQISDMDFISRELVLLGCIHMVNAMHEIDNNNFTISASELNMDALVDVNFIRPYPRDVRIAEVAHQAETLMEAFDLEKAVLPEYAEEDFDFALTSDKVAGMYQRLQAIRDEMAGLDKTLENKRKLHKYFTYMKDIDIRWEDLTGMEYFDFSIGMMPKDNAVKLKNNYSDIPAVLYKVDTLPDRVVVISIAPKSLKVELDRIFNSLSFKKLDVPEDYSGTPREITERLTGEIQGLEAEMAGLRDRIENLKSEYGDEVLRSYSHVKVYEKMEVVKRDAALSTEFFYLAGWIPARKKAELEKRLEPVTSRTQIHYKAAETVGKRITPPTKLRNPVFIRPFEALVAMYGIPSYNELDPTAFVGISYMVLFGAMFGDLGQGLIFLLAGLYLSRVRHRSALGGVLSRLGLSSMVFGALYGSVFGFEEVIPVLLVRPMEDINAMLIGAIALGVVLLTTAYIYNLANAIRRRDLKDGLFGQNGLAGLLFYWILITTVLMYALNGTLPVPLPAVIAVLAVLLGVTVVKEPLANLIRRKTPLHDEKVSDYYIESGFGILETILSMLSNTISFIRVGAFALNHVGLFIAFLTMSEMIHNASGVLILIIGNLVIIGLEGLIVFIQGLRLEYYELFSKYYEGSGVPYEPVRLGYRLKRRPFAGRKAAL